MLKEIVIPMDKNMVRKLPDPLGKKRHILFAHCQAKDLPEFPLSNNPRKQKMDGKIAQDIKKGLTDDTGDFHLLNRGITITAQETSYDPIKGLLHIFLDDKKDGAIDGGHSYAVVRKQVEDDPNLNAFVRLEILEGVRVITTKLAKARNTSAQVRDESLANLSGQFNWIKDILNSEPFGPKVAYRENEEDKPIDIREVIGIMTLFHPYFEPNEKPPIFGYSSKQKCLDLYSNKEYRPGYEMLRNILPTILKLYDYIQIKFPTIYEEIGGFSGLQHKTIERVKIGKVVEVRKYKMGFPLHYLGQTGHFRFPDAWIYPILGSLRALVKYRSVASWKVDNPYLFFDKFGHSYVQKTLEVSKESGRGTPNAVGKNKEHWQVLHHMTNQFYLELLGVDREQEIKV